MYQLYWRQVIPELKSFVNREEPHRFGVQLPIIPQFFTRKDFLNFVPNYEKQEIAKYLERKEKWRRDALKHVVARGGKRTLVLQLQHRKKAPEGMRFALLKTKTLSMVERAKIRQEYLHQRQEIVRSSLARGDFENLSEKTKESILRTGHVPENTDLTCHHILPRSLGGENNVENVCWLGKNDHMRLHRTYIDPLVEYLDGLFEEKRDIFIEMPVPVDTKIPLFFLSKQGFVVADKKTPTFLKTLLKPVKKHKTRLL